MSLPGLVLVVSNTVNLQAARVGGGRETCGAFDVVKGHGNGNDSANIKGPAGLPQEELTLNEGSEAVNEAQLCISVRHVGHLRAQLLERADIRANAALLPQVRESGDGDEV